MIPYRSSEYITDYIVWRLAALKETMGFCEWCDRFTKNHEMWSSSEFDIGPVLLNILVNDDTNVDVKDKLKVLRMVLIFYKAWLELRTIIENVFINIDNFFNHKILETNYKKRFFIL